VAVAVGVAEAVEAVTEDVVGVVAVSVMLLVKVMVDVVNVGVVLVLLVKVVLNVVAVLVLLVVLLTLVVVLLECGHWQPMSSTRIHAFLCQSTGRRRTL
jgi:hypothetical protein